MAIQIRLNSYQLADLRAIRDVPPGKLAEVAERLSGLEKKPIRAGDLRAEVAKVVGDEVAEPLVRQLISLYGIVRQRGLPSTTVLGGVLKAIETADAGWNQDEIASWKQLQPDLRRLLGLPEVRIVATALDLAYEHANLLQSARILTDVRPIYDDPAENIEAAVVGHTLRLRYDSVDGNHSLSVAMDESDVKSLKEQCERALRKSAVARDRMRQGAGIPTVISGDSDDGPTESD